MQFVGFYSFTVNIWNFFAPQEDVSKNVKLKVTFNHHRCYSDENNDVKIENSTTAIQHTIEPGKALAFPMYFGDETLLIELDSTGQTPTVPYLLSAGGTAECLSDEILGDPEPYSYCDTKQEKDGTYWKGGTWAISAGTAVWQMKIKKTIVDPQSDDVTIGPGTPG